jgi:hypothetical protein
MKKSITFLFWLGIQIIILFGLAFCFTWVNEYLAKTGIFGDKPAPNNDFRHDGIEWGMRHIYYFWCCLILWLLSLIRIIIWFEWYWDEQKNKKVYK